MLELSIIILLVSIVLNSLLIYKIFKFIKKIKSNRRSTRILDETLMFTTIIVNIIYISILTIKPSILCIYPTSIFIFNINYLLMIIFISMFYRFSINNLLS